MICFILGHKYEVYAKCERKGSRWLKCKRCKKDFVMDVQTRTLLPMDFEFQDMFSWERMGK